MFITPKQRLIWNDKPLPAGVSVELSDDDAAHLIAEGVAEETPADADPADETETAPAPVAAGKK